MLDRIIFGKSYEGSRTEALYGVMGKKRKSGGRSSGQPPDETPLHDGKIKYDINEEFADSKDEFFAGRDKILLDEGPTSKRRRKVEEEGV